MTPKEKARELVDKFVKYAKRPNSLVDKEYYKQNVNKSYLQANKYINHNFDLINYKIRYFCLLFFLFL